MPYVVTSGDGGVQVDPHLLLPAEGSIAARTRASTSACSGSCEVISWIAGSIADVVPGRIPVESLLYNVSGVIPFFLAD